MTVLVGDCYHMPYCRSLSSSRLRLLLLFTFRRAKQLLCFATHSSAGKSVDVAMAVETEVCRALSFLPWHAGDRALSTKRRRQR